MMLLDKIKIYTYHFACRESVSVIIIKNTSHLSVKTYHWKILYNHSIQVLFNKGIMKFLELQIPQQYFILC